MKHSCACRGCGLRLADSADAWCAECRTIALAGAADVADTYGLSYSL